MPFTLHRVRSVLLVLPFVFIACSGQPTATPAAQATEIIEPEFTPTNTPFLPTATVAATEEIAPTTLHVWWPEPLAPVDDEDAADLLSAQISAFQNANPTVLVDFRLKSVSDVVGQEIGTLMSTLRTAAGVAPSALPDLTLIRRADLLAAAQAGLLQPLRTPPAILNDLHPVVAELGSAEGETYGLAYMVDVEHLAFLDNTETPTRWRLDDVIDSEFTYVFPAGRVNTLSSVFLAQYLDAGQSETASQELLIGGELAIDENVLRSVYAFYEQAVETGVINPDVLEYITPRDYAVPLAEGELNAGVLNSTLYLTLRSQGAALDYAMFPTASGESATVADGWLWVLTTSDAGQQEAAMLFLNWMMGVERQERYSRAIHMLPSQRTALRGFSDTDYTEFVDGLLTRATLPLSDTGGGTPARIVQSGLAMVIGGQRTADQATREVIAQLSG
jgi:ABC-type glycerol-3-phosphate transport system substrate-binding protein